MRRAEGGRGAARLVRRIPRFHSHRAPECTSQCAAGEPTALADQRARPADQPARPADQPEPPLQALEPVVQSSDLPVRPSELPVRPPELSARHSKLRRLFTTFAYLVAKQGATAVLGFAYLAVATHLFSARAVGLAAAASSTAFFLGAIGALGIPLLLVAELDLLPAAARRVTL